MKSAAELASEARQHLSLYTIKDVKLGFPVAPESFPSDVVAIRAFQNWCDQNKGRVIADLEFWYIGEMYTDTGEIVSSPRFLCASNIEARQADLPQEKGEKAE